LHIETWAVFCNGTYLYDFIIEKNLSQKTLQNATFIIFANPRQNNFIIYYINILNQAQSSGTILE